MIAIWNKIFNNGNEIVKTNDKMALLLKEVYKNSFSSNINEWENYCKLITTSDFLMGKGKSNFKASIDWCIKNEVLQRMLEGDYEVDLNNKLSSINENHEEGETNEELIIVKKTIKKYIGEPSYNSWIKPLKFTMIDNNIVITIDQPYNMLNFNWTFF
jgi:hypothetical protein